MPRAPEFVLHQPAASAYHNDRLGLSVERLLNSFETVFNIPKGCVSSEFRDHIRKTLAGYYPNMRTSTARAIVEGKIPGVPTPLKTVHHQWANRMRHALFLMDLFDTMLFDYLESQKNQELSKVVSPFKKEEPDAEEAKTRTAVNGTRKVRKDLKVVQEGG